MSTPHKKRRSFLWRFIKESFFIGLSLLLCIAALLFIWVSTIDLPDFNNFENRAISNSTKIYDRTGNVVLYDVFNNVKRTEVPISEMSDYIKNATVAVEDNEFYSHYGFRPLSFMRAMYVNILAGGFVQGGSTITQQVVKNALLTRDKNIIRKMKEIVLAIKLDREVSKERILEMYLNENPYGGTIYGVEEASLVFFEKKAKDVTLAEAAYLAALPQSPTYYSPYGQHKADLDDRKNFVLRRMYQLGYITEEERTQAQNEVVVFKRSQGNAGYGLHFVFYIREYLERTYGKDMVFNGGLRVVTTLDYELQKELESLVAEKTITNLVPNKASNAALVALDAKNGQILALVGSRNFFDEEIPGQFNVALSPRQPGSSFKPIVYALAFSLGYTPETVLFDIPTQFSSLCDAFGKPLRGTDDSVCYMPQNYDEKFRGPISLRSALAESLNIPAVKLLYLVGIDKAMVFAQSLGLSTINDASRFGLSLVLGGGEVSLLELVSAYGTFANNGVYSRPQGILEVTDLEGKTLETFNVDQREVLDTNTASLISSVLSDNVARTPSFGANSSLYFSDRPVAAKTGTTNDYRDLWVMGYTPSYVLGMWAGNNDNTSVEKRVSGQILAPIWKQAFQILLKDTPPEYFPLPLPNKETKPILRGEYCTFPLSTILTYVRKSDPRQDPISPEEDSQYNLWQTALTSWTSQHSVCGMPPGMYISSSTSSVVEIPPTIVTP